ncbi:MAG: isocitrate lyase/phosphoenolpyruvate mutase family protein [Betaproteobacteria bacterium]|nr:isocitrate lyase/phosphoenolpyruvate mutase family protein [Betaproteobacteria bacterium]MBI3054202.1 isocitrate lyase/phosphoenolpyruvate mutase family protein [Betaproteobacteria bacterium]
MVNYQERRKRFRAILTGARCLFPASVYDALSARIAESVGYELGILAGSVSACTTLAAPDLALQTLTEFANQARRIVRATKLSLMVDADHGYGNALNVIRTVQELEHAGVAAITIEDTALPARFGGPENVELVSIDEMSAKCRAALSARQDDSLVIAARTAALIGEDSERAVIRAKAYVSTGVDAIFITGLQKLGDFDAIRRVVKLPIIMGRASAVTNEDLAARGVRIVVQGHQSLAVVVKSLREVYGHLYAGGAPADLASKAASAQEMDQLMNGEHYRDLLQNYLRSH